MVHLVAFLGKIVAVLPLVLWNKAQGALLFPEKCAGDPLLAPITVQGPESKEFGDRGSSMTYFKWFSFLALLRDALNPSEKGGQTCPELDPVRGRVCVKWWKPQRLSHPVPLVGLWIIGPQEGK